MSLDLNELIEAAFRSNLNTASEHAPEAENCYWHCMQSNCWKIIGHQLPKKVENSSDSISCVVPFLSPSFKDLMSAVSFSMQRLLTKEVPAASATVPSSI